MNKILPKVVVTTPPRYRRNWKPSERYTEEQEVEVLSLHLNKGTMRVRGTKIEWSYNPNIPEKRVIDTWDCSSIPFFEKYEIIEK